MKKLYSLIGLIIILLIIFFIVRAPLAERNNQKAINYYKNNDFVSAEQYFNRALIWKKDNPKVMVNLAKTLIKLEKDSISEQVLDKLLKIAPTNAEYYALSGQISVRKKDYKSGLEEFNKAIGFDSLLAYAYYYRGISKANLNDLAGAASDYTKAQALDKSNIDALKMGISLYVKLENFEASIENYDKLIELDPKNTEALLQRGIFKMNIGDYKSAIIDFSQTIKLSPDLGEAYFNRGKAYGQNKNFKEAAIDFENAFSKNYKPSSSLYNSGLAWLNLNMPENAKKSLKACIKETSNNEYIDNAYQLLGTIELMQNNYKNAIQLFNQSISLDQTNVDSYYNRALAYGYLNEYQKAIDDLNICLQKGKTDAEVYFARGVQKINLQDFKGGCIDLNVASDKGYSAASEMKQTYCR